MLLNFLGTRGGIAARSKEHYFHSSLMISYRKKNIMIDCGKDWLGDFDNLDIEAIFVTHAHPDHIAGLANGASCPVYATQISWSKIKRYSINQKEIVIPRKPIDIGAFLIEAFEVEHSINAPAVGYKITAGKKSIFYVPDLIKVKQQKEALKDVVVYIGDGAIIKRTMLMRKKDSVTTGHAPISMQLAWCQEENVPMMIVTHCGSEIVKHPPEKAQKKLDKLAQEHNVKVIIAFDGMKFKI